MNIQVDFSSGRVQTMLKPTDRHDSTMYDAKQRLTGLLLLKTLPIKRAERTRRENVTDALQLDRAAACQSASPAGSERVLPCFYGHFKEAHNGQKECLCPSEESIALSSSTAPLNRHANQASAAPRLPGNWELPAMSWPAGSGKPTPQAGRHSAAPEPLGMKKSPNSSGNSHG